MLSGHNQKRQMKRVPSFLIVIAHFRGVLYRLKTERILKKVGFNRVCYLCFHWSARCKCLQRKKGLTFCSIKASPFNISLKGVSFIREAVHSVTVMVLISHTYYSRLRCRLAVIGLWWVVGPNLKTMSICNLLKTLSHGLTQCIEQIKPKRISFVFMSSLYTSRY